MSFFRNQVQNACPSKCNMIKHELQVTSWNLKITSWNLKMQVQIHELRVRIHELSVQIHEFKNHLINENSSKQP